jgi:cell wall integrity and stress response component
MSIRLFTVSALMAAVRLASASTGTEVAASDPITGTDTVHGCYSDLGNLVFNQTYLYNSQGACAGFCRDMGKYVGASQAKDCYCGDKYPAKNTLVDDSECTEPCPGFGSQACGGVDTWTVYNTGVRVSVADEANTTSTSSTATSGADATSSQSVVTVSGMS